MLKKILIVAGILLLGIIAYLIKTYSDAGEFKTLKPHFDGTVKQIHDIIGGEDITIDHEKRIAYISADDRYSSFQGKKGFGGIYRLQLDSPDAKPMLLHRLPEKEIHPHGISYYKSPEGQSFLFVVDHTDRKHSILLFRFKDDSTIVQGRSYRDSTFIVSPNDVVAVDENRFYFTNDHGSPTHKGRNFEDYLQLKRANTVFFDGKNYSIAAKRIGYANGINLSRDKRELYVAATIGKSILVYERDTTTGQLALKNEISLDTGVDNIEVDENGNLWVACHPKLLTFVKHANDTSKLAPSQVFKISRDENGNFTSKEIYLNPGEQISASSVAAVTGNILLIGPVLDGNILWCEMK